MPLIYQSNNSSNSLQASVIKVERKIIKDAYFAIRENEPVSEGTPSIHTVVSGDTLGKIAATNSTTVAKIKSDNGLTSDLITVGQQLTLSKAVKKGDKVSFTKIKEAKVGEEVYILVKTENAQDLELKINIKQGVEDGIAKVDQATTVQQDNKDTDCIKVTVGAYCKEEGITNKDDFADWAIAKVKLQPKNTERQKEWSDALECLQDKKSKLYLLIDAHSDNKYHVTYHGRNPDDEGKPDYKTCPNRWLDMDGKWFELGYENCCNTQISSIQLKEIFTTATDDKIKELRDGFNKVFEKFSINTCIRKAHFFAQIREEVGNNISTFAENLNYSVESLKVTFSYFRNNPEEAELYGRSEKHPADQEAIGNRAYANRLGNGGIESGDGWNYRGKGFIQLTGRDNYETVNDEIKNRYPSSTIDIINNPEDILTSDGAILSAMGYWTLNGLNNLADKGSGNTNINAVTAVINLHTSSYTERRAHFETTSKTFKINQCNNITNE